MDGPKAAKKRGFWIRNMPKPLYRYFRNLLRRFMIRLNGSHRPRNFQIKVKRILRQSSNTKYLLELLPEHRKKDRDNELLIWIREREYEENIMNSRFNFMIATTAILVSGVIAIRGTWTAAAISIFGAWLVCIIGGALRRSYAKVQMSSCVISMLGHSTSIVHRTIEKEGQQLLWKPTVHYIGIWIGRFIYLALIILSMIVSPIMWPSLETQDLDQNLQIQKNELHITESKTTTKSRTEHSHKRTKKTHNGTRKKEQPIIECG